LTIPYFSTLKSVTATTGDNTYTLDSIYGGGKFKLSVYESGYSMRVRSTNSFERQKIYKPNSDFENVKNRNRLNDDADVKQNDAFFSILLSIGNAIVDTETVTCVARNAFKAK
jgi:hypothetical protein